METLRSFIQWVGKHRVLSTIAIAIVLILILIYRYVSNRTDGTLTKPISRGKIVDAVYGIGTVTANRSFTLKPAVVGTLTNLFVKEGDSVKSGAKLAQVDNAIYRAPFNGIINYLPGKVGENVFPQIPILVETDLNNRYMIVNMEQQGALRVQSGQKAKLSFDSIRQQNYDGIVQSVYSYNTNFLARIDVSKLPSEILPDMTADVAIIIAEHDNALLVPITALDIDSLWVKRGASLPQKTPVKIGIVDDKMAEIISGDIRDGDQVLIRRKLGP